MDTAAPAAPAVTDKKTNTLAALPSAPRIARRSVPLGQDPLFRLLIIGLLVLCVLSATLAYLLAKRTKEQQQLKKNQSTTGVLYTPDTPAPRVVHAHSSPLRIQRSNELFL